MIGVHPLTDEGEDQRWEVRRDGTAVGTLRLAANRRGTLVLTGFDVPATDAADALDALAEALRERGEDRLGVEVRTGDPAATAAVSGRDHLHLVTTQMSLDLDTEVAPPARVTLRPFTAEEYTGYRELLVTGYAQDMVDAGMFTEPTDALAASELSTRQLLPDGLDSPGQHLWTAYDGDTAVGILWVFVEGTHGYIYDIEVREEQRRRGYGRELLDAAARAARDLGAERLGLNVFGFNEGARALYEQAGYATTERSYRLDL